VGVEELLFAPTFTLKRTALNAVMICSFQVMQRGTQHGRATAALPASVMKSCRLRVRLKRTLQFTTPPNALCVTVSPRADNNTRRYQ
jgi:hypothetical protein